MKKKTEVLIIMIIFMLCVVGSASWGLYNDNKFKLSEENCIANGWESSRVKSYWSIEFVCYNFSDGKFIY